MMGKNSKEKEEIVKDKILGYHDLPLWTQHGVISETSHTKSLLVRLKCPYCQNNAPISVKAVRLKDPPSPIVFN